MGKVGWELGSWLETEVGFGCPAGDDKVKVGTGVGCWKPCGRLMGWLGEGLRVRFGLRGTRHSVPHRSLSLVRYSCPCHCGGAPCGHPG